MAERFLIVSASMGAGHDGAARELANRLEESGHDTKVVDFLECAPGVGRLIKRVYQFQLDVAPWSYEALYRVFFKIPLLYGPLVWLTTVISSNRIRRHISRFEATSVVTTYPLASLVLGKERLRKKITVPVATFVTDFAVHPLWVHSGVDLNLCVHPRAAHAAMQATNQPSLAPGPLVPARFANNTEGRLQARQRLNIPADAQAVLVVAGSWGVGELEETYKDLVGAGDYFPVVACGSNEELRRRLCDKVGSTGLVLGWTDEMPALMAACDVLLQNAGGLTCMEAFASGLPVITYRPIPGHGIENAIEMEEAGVAPFVRSAQDLQGALAMAVSSSGRVTASRASTMFRGDAAEEIQALAYNYVSSALPRNRLIRTFVTASTRRRVVAAATAAAGLYSAFTFGADAAVAHGVDVAKAQPGQSSIYVGVRLGPQTMASTRLATDLAQFSATAIVNGPLASTNSQGIDHLVDTGVNVANGGWGGADDGLDLMLPETNVAKAARAISFHTGVRPTMFVPSTGVNGFDLSAARLEHEQIVRPNLKITAGSNVQRVSSGQIIVVNAQNATEPFIRETLASIYLQATQSGLTVKTFSTLK